MLAEIDITPVHWVGFIVVVLLLLSLDLGVFHRRAHVVKFREALAWTAVWFSLAMAFALAFVKPNMGDKEAVLFITGYITELSLSMDNVFVIALIFTYFRVPTEYQHRVLFWGILGALIMRGVMILAGVGLIEQFKWILYFFGLFLLFTGVKMVFAEEEGVHPEKNPVIRLARKLYPVTTAFEGQKFFTRLDGRVALTPLAIVLLMVETTDLVFAVDSIPAIFGLTTDPFIVFTSNIFAILGLRSLYFVLAGAIGYFRYLKIGLSVVLVFIGVKMLLDPHLDEAHPAAVKRFWFQVQIEPGISLAIVTSIILTSVVFSVIVARHERARKSHDDSGKAS
ncbi:MAG TPA: TerC family protein [Verrucomicrobiae bacterium]|nr:TerC family protein [Verrucomicrobiae bacterium]